MPAIESRSIALHDGRHIRVREHGGGSALPCVFIHGFAEGAHVWDPFLLCAGDQPNRLITLDLPGHGHSSWMGDAGYDRDVLVADLLQVIEQLGLHRMVLIGHSLGGNLAMRMASKLKERAQGLVVVDTAPSPSAQARRFLLNELAECLRPYDSIAEYVQHMMPRRPFAQEKTLRYLALHALGLHTDGRLKLKLDPRIDTLLTQQDEDELWQVIDGLQTPTLVVRGAMSGVLTQQAAQALADRVRAVSLKVVAGAGHAVMLDCPFGFRDAVQDFIWLPR